MTDVNPTAAAPRERKSHIWDRETDDPSWRQYECVPWLGPKDKDGYGKVKWRGGDWRAHRLSFALSFGQIPDGLLVLHHCDNPACCNPRHLFLGTHADNTRDKAKKGRPSRHGGTASGDRHGSRTKPNRVPRGEKHGNAKLTDTQVAAILASEKTQRALAREYGVSQTTISNIRLGKIWRLIFEHRFFGMPQMAWLHRDEGKP